MAYANRSPVRLSSYSALGRAIRILRVGHSSFSFFVCGREDVERIVPRKRDSHPMIHARQIFEILKFGAKCFLFNEKLLPHGIEGRWGSNKTPYF
jgi:hypothetical protein